MKKLLLLIFLLGCAAAFFIYFAVQYVRTPVRLSDDVFVTVQKGDSLLKIAQTLKDNGLITKKFPFILYCKIKKAYPEFKAGEYLVSGKASITELVEILTEGKVYQRKITIPEGLNVREIKKILDENEYLSGTYEDFAEGEILPETYTFSRGDSREAIIRQAKKALIEKLNNAWENRDLSVPLKSKDELMVLASIVEKETGIKNERPQVASVFANRLKIGMLLQTDPTVIYALTKGEKELGRPLYLKDLETDSPYNTYKYAGLPPNPICTPGKDAIFAAAHPDKTPYLYFVAAGNGGHNFARTLAEHNENVRKWRMLNKHKSAQN